MTFLEQTAKRKRFRGRPVDALAGCGNLESLLDVTGVGVRPAVLCAHIVDRVKPPRGQRNRARVLRPGLAGSKTRCAPLDQTGVHLKVWRHRDRGLGRLGKGGNIDARRDADAPGLLVRETRPFACQRTSSPHTHTSTPARRGPLSDHTLTAPGTAR